MTNIPDEMNRAELAAVQMEASQRRATDDQCGLINTLRHRHRVHDLGGVSYHTDSVQEMAADIIEAQAAKITDLRVNLASANDINNAQANRIAELDGALDILSKANQECNDALNAAEARAERYREALQEIAKEHRAPNCRSRKWIARGALNDPKPEPTDE